MEKALNERRRNKKQYGGFRRQSTLFTDNEEYLLGITNEELYGGELRISGHLEAHIGIYIYIYMKMYYLQPIQHQPMLYATF